MPSFHMFFSPSLPCASVLPVAVPVLPVAAPVLPVLPVAAPVLPLTSPFSAFLLHVTGPLPLCFLMAPFLAS